MLFRSRRRGAGALTAVVVLLVALTSLEPARTRGALAGMASPFETALDPVLPPLRVQPGDLEVMRGSDVELAISAVGRLQVEVLWQASGDIARRSPVAVTDGEATHVFRTVSAPIVFHVRGDDGSRTDEYRIEPIDPLFVSDLVVRVSYPPHTGKIGRAHV